MVMINDAYRWETVLRSIDDVEKYPVIMKQIDWTNMREFKTVEIKM